MYDVNFVYNALSFLRLTSRSSVNHVFVVLNKHILYLVVVKFPTLFSSLFAGFLLWAQGTWTYQGPRCIEVHEVVVLLLGGFLSTFSEQSLLNGSIKSEIGEWEKVLKRENERANILVFLSYDHEIQVMIYLWVLNKHTNKLINQFEIFFETLTFYPEPSTKTYTQKNIVTLSIFFFKFCYFLSTRKSDDNDEN